MENIIGQNLQLSISMKQIVFILYVGLLFGDYGGGYAGSGFRYSSNAREFSLAGALIADKTPGFYAFSNPSLLKYARSSQIGISYQSMSLDRSIQSISFVKNLPPSAGVGLAVLRAGTENIQGKNSMNEQTQIFSAQEIKGIISFGVSFNSRLAFGINIKAFFSSIAPEIINVQSSKGMGWDVGFLYKFHRHFILGGIIENLNSSYIWRMTKYNDQETYEEFFPQSLKLGVSYTGYRDVSIYFQEDMVNTPGNHINYRYRLGIEYILSNRIKLRGGLRQARGALSSDVENIGLNIKSSVGLGIPLKIWKRQYVQLDYALDPGIVGEGLSHLFSFSMEVK